MQVDTLETAVSEAKRFLKKATAVKISKWESGMRYITSDPKLTGALRRASMDLTRALAELRRP
jgi:hypothetical protein